MIPTITQPLTRAAFAAALRMHRERLGLTQDQARRLLGVSKRVLENWERQEGGSPLDVTMEGAERLRFAKPALAK